MSEQVRVLVMLALSMGGYILATMLLVLPRLEALSRRLLIGLTIFEVALIVLHLFTRGSFTFWQWLVNPGSELAIGAAFSAAQFLIIVLVALFIAIGTKQSLWQRAYWMVLAALFTFLWLDEYFGMHDVSVQLFNLMPFMGIGIAALTVFALVLFYRDEPLTLIWIFVGVGVIGFAGLIIDAVANSHIFEFGSISIDWFVLGSRVLGVPIKEYEILEEFLEMAGATLILVAMLSYMQRHIAPQGWRRSVRILALGLGLWIVFAIANVWVLPSIEQRFFGDAVAITYPDAAPQIVAVNVDDNACAPGDTIDITIFANTGQFLDRDYYVSVHLVTQPDGQSVAQADVQLGAGGLYPSSAWLPGFSTRNDVQLLLPDDVTVPGGYWVIARIWHPIGESIVDLTEEDLVGIDIIASENRLLTSDSVVLATVPVVDGSAEPPSPPMPLMYTFEGNVVLSGIDLPEQAVLGGELPLTFWWQTGDTADVDVDYIQFVHMFHSNGQDYHVFDHEPFDNRFPTSAWPANIHIQDGFAVPLPADLPPGEYTIHTGLYEPIMAERIPVVDELGSLVQDHSILLGTVLIEAAGD